MLNLRYFAQFKGRPTLLISGDQIDLDPLVSFFGEWDGLDVDLLDQLRIAQLVGIEGIKTLIIHRTRGDVVSVLEWIHSDGIWNISTGAQEKITSLLGGLRSSDSPCHQYLDIGPSNSQIMCSVGEYDFGS